MPTLQHYKLDWGCYNAHVMHCKHYEYHASDITLDANRKQICKLTTTPIHAGTDQEAGFAFSTSAAVHEEPSHSTKSLLCSAVRCQFSPNYAHGLKMRSFPRLVFPRQTGSRNPNLELCEYRFLQFHARHHSFNGSAQNSVVRKNRTMPTLYSVVNETGFWIWHRTDRSSIVLLVCFKRSNIIKLVV